MGLGGVAIAVLPSVVYPKQSFSDRLGGSCWKNDKKSGYARHHVLHTPLFFACM